MGKAADANDKASKGTRAAAPSAGAKDKVSKATAGAARKGKVATAATAATEAEKAEDEEEEEGLTKKTKVKVFFDNALIVVSGLELDVAKQMREKDF